LIYLAMPVGQIIEFLENSGHRTKPGVVITDAGSTKVEICGAAHRHLKDARQFVGGHPIAGSHLQGLAHARADLFAGAPYVLIHDENQDEGQTHAALRETLELMGANVTLMTAREHDRAMALVSHLPQVMASALAAIVKDQHDADALLRLSGAGYRDMTRLAASPWAMWGDILMSNATETVAALGSLIGKLTSIRDELRSHLQHGGKLEATQRLFGEPGLAIEIAPGKETNNASHTDS
jgi:prephenate dehydrogenase